MQDGEAGGITQQIGATNMPREAIQDKTSMCKEVSSRRIGWAQASRQEGQEFDWFPVESNQSMTYNIYTCHYLIYRLALLGSGNDRVAQC